MDIYGRDYFEVLLILCQNNFFLAGHDSVILRPLSLSSFRFSCLDGLAWYKAGRKSSRVFAIPDTSSLLQSMIRSKSGFRYSPLLFVLSLENRKDCGCRQG